MSLHAGFIAMNHGVGAWPAILGRGRGTGAGGARLAIVQLTGPTCCAPGPGGAVFVNSPRESLHPEP